MTSPPTSPHLSPQPPAPSHTSPRLLPQVRLPGSDAFYVHETYTIEVLETIRTLKTHKDITVHPNVASTTTDGATRRLEAVVVIPVDRPARRIQCLLHAEVQTGDKERQLVRARRQLHEFMSKNKVYFNGAAEPATQLSAMGTAQSWSVEHLDGASRNANRVTLDGIAAIMKASPDVSLEVRGETTKHTKAEKLGVYFGMHPTEEVRNVTSPHISSYICPGRISSLLPSPRRCTVQVRAIMDLLARRRGEACYEALKARGVEAARMWVTSAPMGEAMKVDFVPHASQIPEQYEPLPAGMPFRILHQRHADYGLGEAMRRMKLFMDSHSVHFNGAGEQLPQAEQAWSIAHVDPAVARANRETLAGIARIMIENHQCALEIHGETGDAKAAPRQLAAYLDMNRTTQVRAAKDQISPELLTSHHVCHHLSPISPHLSPISPHLLTSPHISPHLPTGSCSHGPPRRVPRPGMPRSHR